MRKGKGKKGVAQNSGVIRGSSGVVEETFDLAIVSDVE